MLDARRNCAAEAAQGQRIVMNLDPGGESTIFVNGKSFGACRADWVGIPHHHYVDQTLTMEGQPGERFDLLLEAYAGHFYPQSALGGCSTGPVRPGDYEAPDPKAPRKVVGSNTFGIWHESAYQLWLDVQMLKEIMEMGDPNALRTEKIEQALCDFTLMVDFEQPRAARLQDYERAGRRCARSWRPITAARPRISTPLATPIWTWPGFGRFRRPSARLRAPLPSSCA